MICLFKINIKNYKQAVSIPVVGENGHEWVLIWDEADVEVDGKTTKVQWQDGFRFSNGKIVHLVFNHLKTGAVFRPQYTGKAN